MAVGDKEEFLCKVCGEAITFSSGGVSCRSCSTLHHRLCWEYTGTCSVYACHESRFLVCGMDQLSGEASTLPVVSQAEDDSAALVPSQAGSAVARLEPGDLEHAEPHQCLLDAEYPRITGGTQYCPECHSVNPGFVESCAYCDFPIAKAAKLDPSMVPRRNKPLVPAGVMVVRSLDRIASIGVAVFGTWMSLQGLAGLWHLNYGGPTVACGWYLQTVMTYATVGPLLVVAGLMLHLMGSYYGMGRRWARWMQLPVSLILLSVFPVGTIFGLAMLISWFLPSTWEFFRRERPPAPSLPEFPEFPSLPANPVQ